MMFASQNVTKAKYAKRSPASYLVGTKRFVNKIEIKKAQLMIQIKI